MSPVILFDLDGVLIDSRETHFDALNKALAEVDGKYVISKEEQATTYEGLTTNEKLLLLSKLKGLGDAHFAPIWEAKQKYTAEALSSVSKDIQLIEIMEIIKSRDFKIGVVSNSTRKTLDQVLTGLGVGDYIDFTVSNEDVQHPKPHPEGYLKAIEQLGGTPETTAIFEDSVVGREAAEKSGARLISVDNREELTSTLIRKVIKDLEPELVFNLLIPMAGAGNRFAEAGYEKPKPLIEVKGKPMIQQAIYSLDMNGNYIYIVQSEHEEKYDISSFVPGITPLAKSVTTVVSETLTQGAASSSLLAKDLINNDSPLIICNSDQIVEWDSKAFLRTAGEQNLDGCIAVFESDQPRWSYAKLGDGELVSEVAEKKVISNLATVGIYYWKRGSDYVKYAEQMISKDVRVNGEFYICPVYNEAIADGLKVGVYKVDAMHGLGTPEDLEAYVNG